MLTSRGWWFFFLIMIQISLGMILSERVGPIIAVVGLVLLAWFAFEWLMFQIRTSFAMPKLRARRLLRAKRRQVSIVWAGQEFTVRVSVVLDSQVSLPYLTLQDRPPSGCDRVSGTDNRKVSLTSEEAIHIEYVLRCPVPGEIRFEGIRLQISDLQGFFYRRSFIRQPATYLVLPPLADAEGNRRATKSHNVLPPPGLHRLRQSGGGSELHDLREYRPGDPPKMIAWKASARRDRLITKEFESDVPVRCTLFVDVSQSVRLGPTRDTMLNQITTIASGVSQAALADRDHVGLVLFDDQTTEILRPARSSRHLIELLHRLARANSAAPVSPSGDTDALLQLANPLAHEIYPDLMDCGINQAPYRMFWEPILDTRKSWLVLLSLLPLLSILSLAACMFVSWLFRDEQAFRACVYVAEAMFSLFGSTVWSVIVALLLAVFGLLVWGLYGLSGLIGPWARTRLQRKQLSALFAVLDDAPMGTEARYLDNDGQFAERAQRFLAEHHRRYPLALFDEKGRYLFRSEEKIDVLSRALLHSVARGRDNELFVLLADLFELEDCLSPVVRAVRVACARHHHVLVICPWMPGIPVVDEKLAAPQRAKAVREHALQLGFKGLQAQLFRQMAERYHQSFQRLRHEFGKSGVLLVRATARIGEIDPQSNGPIARREGPSMNDPDQNARKSPRSDRRGGGRGLFQLLREPAMRNYLFVAIAALIIYYLLASARTQGGGDLGILLAVVVAVPGLIGRWTISPACFLILTTYLFIDPNFGSLLFQSDATLRRSRYGRAPTTLEIKDLLLVASILVYLIAQFRLLSLVHKSMPDDPPPRRRGQAEPAVPRRPASLFADRELGMLLLLAVCCTMTGFLGWLAITTYAGGGQLRGVWGIQLPFARLLLFGWGFASALALLVVFFRYRALCKMSRREARLLLQDSFWFETRREQERIYRWQRWYRKRRDNRTINERS